MALLRKLRWVSFLPGRSSSSTSLMVSPFGRLCPVFGASIKARGVVLIICRLTAKEKKARRAASRLPLLRLEMPCWWQSKKKF